MFAKVFVLFMFASVSLCAEGEPPEYILVTRVARKNADDIKWEVDSLKVAALARNISGKFHVKKTIDKWTGKLDVIYCDDVKRDGTCVLVMQREFDGCKSFESQGKWYSHVAQGVEPELKCPVKPGTYTFHNTRAAFFDGPELRLGEFRFTITGLDEHDKEQFTLQGEFEVKEDTNEIRRAYGLPPEDRLPEDEFSNA